MSIKIAKDWKDYEIIATGDGYKLERWKNIVLLRPDPQVVWNSKTNLNPKSLNAKYVRSSDGGGRWEVLQKFPDEWNVSWKNLSFCVKPMGFKHTGLFPEQAVNWESMIDLISSSKREINVLNLFAYTGGATVACASAGAKVCHVDSAKNMVDRAKKNLMLSGLMDSSVRFIVDDCRKFVEREIRRGNKYDAIIMDPPSYGRGTNGEVWKLEDDLYSFVELCEKVLVDNPLFVLINCYTTGMCQTAIENVLRRALNKKGKYESYELGLPTDEKIILPCGTSALYKGE